MLNVAFDDLARRASAGGSELPDLLQEGEDVKCLPASQPNGIAPLKADRSLKYIYGFPLVANYQTKYKQAIDTNNSDDRASFNMLANSSGVATPEEKFVVTANSDTPYSLLWMDLRTEPIVVAVPKIGKHGFGVAGSLENDITALHRRRVVSRLRP